MTDEIVSLQDYLEKLNEEFGGDIGFIPTVTEDKILNFETIIGWRLPEIFRHLLLNECNGIIIGNKRIFSTYEKEQKKTFVDNLERNNDPAKSSWFKTRPEIFKDYVVIGADLDICFCYSKKYSFVDPAIYICTNPNGRDGVDFERLNFGLEGLISVMVSEEFEDDDQED